MALEVRWSNEAEFQLEEIINYLENNWTKKEIKSFFKRLEEGIEEIRQYPLRHKISDRKNNTREFQLSPHTTIFYTFNDQTLDILLLWPNKKNPSKLI